MRLRRREIRHGHLASRDEGGDRRTEAERDRTAAEEIDQTELVERSRKALANLEHTLMGDPRRGRQEIVELVWPIRVNTTPDEIRLESQKGRLEQYCSRRRVPEGLVKWLW